ncbi:MAG: SPW repeat protein [Ktedonobacteraceae bacterium]|jgi:SPW repeat-containing protein|nr:SPW repeat protein [Ktedonobacteraceae bacterium]
MMEARTMKPWTRWQDWTILVLGVLLFISPWVLGFFRHASGSWVAWILGVIGVLLALWALRLPFSHIAPEWITVVLGIVLFICPWVFGFSAVTAAAWTSWIIGILFVIIGGWCILESRTPRGTGATV